MFPPDIGGIFSIPSIAASSTPDITTGPNFSTMIDGMSSLPVIAFSAIDSSDRQSPFIAPRFKVSTCSTVIYSGLTFFHHVSRIFL